MMASSKLSILSFKDLSDLESLKSNNFKKMKIEFNLKDLMNELINMMEYKALQVNNKINFNIEF